MIHSFKQCLAKSHAAEDLPFWASVYRKSFPDMVALCSHRADGEHQRAGIDRSITLANAKQVLIDEKVRFATFTDIALEYLSDERRNIPGWVCKPLRADYIAYAIAPIGRCYLMPVAQMQLAWRLNSSKWFTQPDCREISVKNYGWVTKCLCVPANKVLGAISNTMCVPFDPYTADNNQVKQEQLWF